MNAFRAYLKRGAGRAPERVLVTDSSSVFRKGWGWSHMHDAFDRLVFLPCPMGQDPDATPPADWVWVHGYIYPRGGWLP